MNQVWVLILSAVALLGFWLGVIVSRSRTKRDNSQRFRVIFDDFINGNDNHDLALALPLPRDQRALHDLYVKCKRGLHDRAYTIASQLHRTQPSREVSAILLRLGLFLNRYDHLDHLLNQPESLGGLARITFANLVCSGRWQEAVSFYKLSILDRQGSKVEWRLLQLCASAFAEMPVDKSDMSEYEIELLSRLLAEHTMQENEFKSVSDYLSVGVCHLDELRFLENRELFHLDDESNVNTSHPTKERAIRGDWIGAEYEVFRREFGVGAPQTRSSRAHLLRVQAWLQSQRGYNCSHCSEARRGFGLICNHCLRLDIGQPTRIEADDSVPHALVVHGVNMVRVERIYWTVLLHAT